MSYVVKWHMMLPCSHRTQSILFLEHTKLVTCLLIHHVTLVRKPKLL